VQVRRFSWQRAQRGAAAYMQPFGENATLSSLIRLSRSCHRATLHGRRGARPSKRATGRECERRPRFVARSLPRGELLTERTQAEVATWRPAGEPWADEASTALYPIIASALQKVLHRSDDYEDLVQSSFELIVRSCIGR